ncbi:hypothetical protein EZJ49_11545 [Bdellovibrio bacteriovorus]|uniref:hypothetical protein n=1 Tax=Bdellovibrio bacteriovorus TaxID=959 RepID=UPI0021CF67FC|nr:hypothetical protein [Bdellovibrio bacteriovorus]UXR63704.1 hypothetical protein EZJ49_11545 [Bdellovibrio bacteriovorus]
MSALVTGGCSMNVSLSSRNINAPSIVGDTLINTTVPNQYSLSGSCDADYPVTIQLPDGSQQTEKCIKGQYAVIIDTSTWPDGILELEVRQADGNGVIHKTTQTIHKDTTAPSVTVTTNIPAPYLNATAAPTVAIAGTCSEEDLPVALFLNATPLMTLTCQSGAYSAVLDLTSAAEGPLNLTAKQSDAAHNETMVAFASTTKDTIAPSGSITFSGMTPSPSASTSDRTVGFILPADSSHFKVFAVKDELCITRLADLIASTELSTGDSYTLNIPSDGVYQICALARDLAGNYQTVPTSSSLLTIDTASHLSLSTPTVSRYQNGYTLLGSCDAGDTLVISGDDSGLPYSMTCPLDGNFSKTVVFSGADGNKTFTVSSEDALGNTNSASQSVIKDTSIVAPTITAKHLLDSHPDASFTLSDCNDATYVYITESGTIPTLATAGWQACSVVTDNYIWDLTAGADGLRTVKFFFRDEAGNISPSTSINLNYDSQAPVIQITNVPDPLPSGIAYAFSWKITEAAINSSNVVTVKWYNGSTWSTIATPTVGQNGPLSEYLMSVGYSPSTVGAGQKISVAVTDNSGLTTTAESNTFTIVNDVAPPTITSPLFKINGSTTPAATIKSVLDISFATQDADTATTHFCLKTTNSAPVNSADSCWISLEDIGVAPSNNVVVSDYKYVLLPPVSGTYNIHLWVMDRKQNISVQTASPVVGKDYVAITYSPNPIPEVSYVLAANTSAPFSPPLSSQTIVNQGSEVFIYWNATDNNTVTSIDLQASTDGINYTNIATGLNNGVNGSCALSADFTGCARWTNTYTSGTSFFIKVLAKDNDGQIGVGLSTPFNSSQFRIIAGNINSGDGGDARGALFSPPYYSNAMSYGMAVMSDGKILVNDNRGLVLVDPQAGQTEVLLTLTNSGTYSGDGGPVRLAKAIKILKVAVDFNDNIWIYDHQKIRRINTHVTPWIIESIIGGTNDNVLGTLNNDIILDPRDLKIDTVYNTDSGRPLVPAPNGDLYFSADDEGASLLVYRGSLSSPRLERIQTTGTGTWQSYNGITGVWSDVSLSTANRPLLGYMPQWNINRITTHLNLSWAEHVVGNTNIRFSKINLDGSLISPYYTQPYTNTTNTPRILPSLDGETYIYNKTSYSNFTLDVKKLNKADGTWTRVLGGDAVGISPDGSSAINSPVRMEAAFVTRTGDIYFIEAGKIRVVKNGNGKIYTLYGISKDQGDGGPSLKSRFGSIQDIAHGPANNVIIQDIDAMKIREVSVGANANSMVHLGGNGTVTEATDGASALTSGLKMGIQNNNQQMLITDPETGDVFRNCFGLTICRLNHSSKTWTYLMSTTAGTTWMTTTTPANYSTLSIGYNPMIMQFAKDSGNNKLLMIGAQTWNGAQYSSAAKVVNIATTLATNIYGGGQQSPNAHPNLCPEGTLSESCVAHRYPTFYMQATSQYLPAENSWLVPIFDVGYWPGGVDAPAGSYIRKIKIGAGIEDVTTLPGEIMTSFLKLNNRIYFCNNLGRFKYQELTGAYPIYEVQLPPGIFCTGRSMLYKASDSTLPERIVFPISGNGAMGVMEYEL